MKLVFDSSEQYPEDVTWTLEDSLGAEVADGGFLGNKCIYLQDDCYRLNVFDAWGDGNAGWTVYIDDVEYPSANHDGTGQFRQKGVDVCTIVQDCAELAITPDA